MEKKTSLPLQIKEWSTETKTGIFPVLDFGFKRDKTLLFSSLYYPGIMSIPALCLFVMQD